MAGRLLTEPDDPLPYFAHSIQAFDPPEAEPAVMPVFEWTLPGPTAVSWRQR